MSDRFAAPLAALLALILVGCESRKDMGPAPPFTLTATGGERFSLEEQRGKVVIVSFFGTW
jgi:cytochrome oxidase Cu insertion factor (SCO1/SenC/PrrC family)